MKYIETINLFNLENIQYEKLNEKCNSSKLYIEVNNKNLKNYLNVLRDEFVTSQMKDLNVIITIEITNKKNGTIYIKIVSEKLLYPHLSITSNKFIKEMSLDKFNASTTDAEDLAKKDIENIVSRTQLSNDKQVELLKLLNRTTEIFELESEIRKCIYKNKIYEEYIKFKTGLFIVEYNKFNIKIKSIITYKKNTSNYPIMNITIDVNNHFLVSLELYGQHINLNADDLKNIDEINFNNLIITILKMKKYDVNKLEDFYNELLIKEMEKI